MRRWRFTPLNFIRRTELEPTTKLSYEALHRHFCKTAVGSWCSVVSVCKPLSLLSFSVIVCRVVRCVFYFFRRVGKFFKNNFVLRWLCKLFDKALVCAWASAALAMCLQIALAFCLVILVEVPIPLKIYYASLLLW